MKKTLYVCDLCQKEIKEFFTFALHKEKWEIEETIDICSLCLHEISRYIYVKDPQELVEIIKFREPDRKLAQKWIKSEE